MHFELGDIEISQAAEAALRQSGIRSEDLLRRHLSGEWGNVAEHCAQANDLALHEDRPHAIRSRHLLPSDGEAVIVTSVDRSRTRLQLLEEYRTLEVSAAEGYAVWAREYDTQRPIADCEEAVLPQ